MMSDRVPTGWAMSAVLATYLRAQRVPQRLVAIAVTAVLGAAIARAPAPAVRVDLEAASYPAVLIGALVPVLIGVLATAPAPVRLRWLTAAPTSRVRWLRATQLVLVTAVASAAAAFCGAPARLVGAAVQNALVTLFVAELLAVLIGSGVATAMAGAAAVVMLLVSPGLAGQPWVVIDTQADVVDWLLLLALAGAATAGMMRAGPAGET